MARLRNDDADSSYQWLSQGEFLLLLRLGHLSDVTHSTCMTTAKADYVQVVC